MARLELNFGGIAQEGYETFDVTPEEGRKVIEALGKSNDGSAHNAFSFDTTGDEGDDTPSTVWISAGLVAWAELDHEKPGDDS